MERGIACLPAGRQADGRVILGGRGESTLEIYSWVAAERALIYQTNKGGHHPQPPRDKVPQLSHKYA